MRVVGGVGGPLLVGVLVGVTLAGGVLGVAADGDAGRPGQIQHRARGRRDDALVDCWLEAGEGDDEVGLGEVDDLARGEFEVVRLGARSGQGLDADAIAADGFGEVGEGGGAGDDPHGLSSRGGGGGGGAPGEEEHGHTDRRQGSTPHENDSHYWCGHCQSEVGRRGRLSYVT